jgi:endonuclease G
MKKVILLISVLFLSSYQISDLVVVKHTNYTSTFSKTNRYPVIVEWWITKKMVQCDNPIERKDSFRSDPKIPSYTNLSKHYKNSGYDRGHMMPAADNLCQSKKIQEECFYFSNISPQHESLNRGDWKSLESESRKYSKNYDSIHIWAGNIGQIEKIGIVSVPKYCWKVIHIKSLNIKKGYIFENKHIPSDGIENNEVDVKVIEQLTGLIFN